MRKLQFTIIVMLCLEVTLYMQERQNISLTGRTTDTGSKKYMAGFSSALFPGAGYLFLQDYQKALLSAGLLLPIANNYYTTTPGYSGMSVKKNLYFTAVNMSRFVAYDSYQSALNCEDRSIQKVKISHYSLGNFFNAPFNENTYHFEDSPSYTVLIPLAIISIIPIIKVSQKGIHKSIKWENATLTIPLIFLQSYFFAVGEESYFRGFIYPAMSDVTGSKWAGNLIQSLYFGFEHTSFAQENGLNQFPHMTGALFHFTTTIDKLKEFIPAVTPSGNFDGMKELPKFFLMSSMGFGMGILACEFRDGLLKATLFHFLVTGFSILTDYLTEGNTGRFCMEIRLTP